MRKLKVFESISIDGYFTDAEESVEWTHAGREDPEFAAWLGANAGSGNSLLFGRKTYEMMASYWPTSAAAQQMPAVAKGMNNATKFVVSRSLQPTWENTRLLRGDLVAAVRELKADSGPAITLLGSGSVASQLGEAGLVDEYQFVILPIALGSGRTIFSDGRALKLLNQQVFRCGNVVVTYAAEKAAASRR